MFPFFIPCVPCAGVLNCAAFARIALRSVVLLTERRADAAVICYGYGKTFKGKEK